MHISDRCFYFFDQGLRFKCLQCGKCCTGDPGTVYVAPGKVRSIAAYLGLPEEVLTKELLYPFLDSYSIKEDARGNCLMYAGGCRIYPLRPVQCRTWPFWFKNLRSRYAWKQTALECPGIGRGPVYTREEILSYMGG